jgi:O-antigen ligase
VRQRAWNFVQSHKGLFVCAGLFLLGATVSLFFTLNPLKAFDQWRGYYVEPFFLMVVFAVRLTNRQDWEYAVDALVLSTAGVSALAVYQHFTGWGIINPFWQAPETRRVTSIFGYPNGIGLYVSAVAPLITGTLLYYVRKGQGALNTIRSIVYSGALIIALCSIWWAQSTGAILAVAGAAFFAALFEHRLRCVVCIGAVAVALALVSASPNNPHRQEILFQDLSGQIRLNMWRETFTFLKDYPVQGAGLFSYQQRIPAYHKMHVEIYQYPHNILLNFWVDAGLIGLVGFLGVLITLVYMLIKRRSFFAWVAVAGLVSILIHGLVDVPILRYDLAVIFWITAAAGLVIEDKM